MALMGGPHMYYSKAVRQSESGKIASVQIVLCNSGIPRASKYANSCKPLSYAHKENVPKKHKDNLGQYKILV
ncbi:hypothetical protein LguiB_028089 [Lonicera macranthoides]